MVTGMDAIEQETKVTNEEEAKFDIDWGVTILQQGDMMQLTYYQWPCGCSEQRVLPGTTRISSMGHRRNHKPTLHCQERQDTRDNK